MKKFFALLAAVVLLTACNTKTETVDESIDTIVVDSTEVEGVAADTTVVAE